MSADKRSVATDALETLGTIIGDKEKRDAIHLAVEPVVAGECLVAGEHIILENGVAFKAAAVGEGLGIVDPFLQMAVNTGDKFWLVVYPRQISSLRHVWEHPAFPASLDTTREPDPESIAFIENLAAEVGISYDRLLSGAEEYLSHGSYITGGDEMEGMGVPDEFWDHYQNVTQTRVKYNDRGNFFNCSC